MPSIYIYLYDYKIPNVFHRRAVHPGEPSTLPSQHHEITDSTMSLPTNAQSIPKETRIQLTIQAIERGQIHTERHAITTYQVPRSTLRDRRARKTPRVKTRPNLMKLTAIEEEVIIKYILDLNARGYSPSLAQV